ncbi:alpha-mannosidase 2 [Stylonychia lemnae]|uniref:Alpha-mannosidase 2 n=1 Tax=Stylonychia lemnae TaxID=5949 RepID=A0A078AZT4_STYLE|nr:alpha-mannosidase 2 [Stylonychia lemnae]|eukprot:CDW87606.1 alpha-mannosidase 2 [Stylonychia lemnae]
MEVNLLIVPHSHTDPGWLETLEIYYRNQVKEILHNIVVELQSDAMKKFTWAEVCFLKMYYDEITVKQRKELYNLIMSGQLEIVGGGWVQHDETLTSYRQQIAQMETGIDWLIQTFPGIESKLKTMWQIDSFGSSELTPLLFNQEQESTRVQFENIVLNRVGDEVKDRFKQEQSMDFLWQHSLSQSQETNKLLTHILHHHYETKEYEFMKTHLLNPQPSQIDVKSFLIRYGNSVIVPYLENQSHENIMLLVGNDFAYMSKGSKPNQQDVQNFRMIDNMITILNEYSQHYLGYKVKARYATPSEYFDLLKSQMKNGSLELPEIETDFSLYDEKFHKLHPDFQGKNRVDYWSGYYSNRPALKFAISKAFNFYFNSMTFLNLAQMLIDNQQGINPFDKLTSEQLAISKYQNKTTVPNDNPQVSKKVQKPFKGNQLQKYLVELAQIVSIGTHHDTLPSTSRDNVHMSELLKFNQAIEASSVLVQRQYLHLFGASEVEEDEEEIKVKGEGRVKQYIVFNKEGYSQNTVLKFITETKYVVVKKGDEFLESDVTNTFICTDRMGKQDKQFNLIFKVQLLPLSATVIDVVEYQTLEDCQQVSAKCSSFIQPQTIKLGQDLYMENSQVKFEFNNQNYMAQRIDHKLKHQSIEAKIDIVRFSGVNSESGAYIMAPDSNYIPLKLSLLDGFYVKGRFQDFLATFYTTAYRDTCFAVQTVTLDRKGDKQDVAHIKFKSFPLSNDDVFMRIRTNLTTQSQLYTHNSLYYKQAYSNNRYVSPRDIGSKIYPAVYGAILKQNDQILSLFTGERASGIGSVEAGEILMGVGRRNDYDDDKGLPDGVTETNPIFSEFSMGLYDVNEINTKGYKQRLHEEAQQMMIVTTQDKVYQFEKREISFGQIQDHNTEIIYAKFNNQTNEFYIKTLEVDYNQDVNQNFERQFNSSILQIERSQNNSDLNRQGLYQFENGEISQRLEQDFHGLKSIKVSNYKIALAKLQTDRNKRKETKLILDEVKASIFYMDYCIEQQKYQCI